MATFIKAIQLKQWAEQEDARGMLPQLIRKLATETLNNIEKIRFPAFESVHRPGFDGEIVSKLGNAWVPSGQSFWELSNEKSPAIKFKSDYDKRIADVPSPEVSSEIRKQSTFVFVTPRQFHNKAKLSEEYLSKGDWKDVRIYDCDDLEHWLENAFAVAIWFGEAIDMRPPGVDSLSAKWKAISSSTKHVLLPSVFVVDRSNTIKSLNNWWREPANWLAIASRSPIEVIDFICAWYASLEEADRSEFESRAVLIEEMQAWKTLRESNFPLMLIVHPSISLEPDELTRATSKNHHVLIAVESSRKVRTQTVVLERPSQFALAGALEDSGYEPIESVQFARACGGSLSILKNRLSGLQTNPIPTWAETISPATISASLLLGGWDERNNWDLAAFEELSGIPYSDSEADLQKLSSCRDSILLQAAGNWRQISKDDAWTKFGIKITPTVLKTYETLAVKILVDDDRRYSRTVKKHVAETLALLGMMGQTIEADSSIDTKAMINRIVDNVLSPIATWHRWASLGLSLSLLAEASPEHFVRAVQADLNKPFPEILKLFNPYGSPPSVNCYHSGILWALESLAWSSKYLPNVAKILLLLADSDPGGTWTNRPDNSLAEILSCRIPQTTAVCKERVQILDLLIKENSNATWLILVKLLRSTLNSIATATQKPYWRDWATSWSRGVSTGEIQLFLFALGERIVEQAGLDAKRWTVVFELLVCFPDAVRPKLLNNARFLSNSDLADNERQQLAGAISKLINLHRRPNKKDWVFPVELLEELEQLEMDFTPQTDVMKSVSLFDERPDMFYRDEIDHDTLPARVAALFAARKGLIKQITTNSGFDGIMSLVAHSEAVFQVGNCLAIATEDVHLNEIIPAQLHSGEREREFANGFIGGRWSVSKWEWAKSTLAFCDSSETKSWFLAAMPFVPECWDLANAEGKETDDLYWERCRRVYGELDAVGFENGVAKLTKYGRFSQALDLLSDALVANQPISIAIMILPLDAIISSSRKNNQTAATQDLKFRVPNIIAALQSRDDVDETLMRTFEFEFLEFLNRSPGPESKTLFKHLATRPEFFIEMLSDAFKSNSETIEAKEDPAFERNNEIAFKRRDLLREWSLIPGTQKDGTIDQSKLLNWCSEARLLATECGRLEQCDDLIGRLFAHAPMEINGTWPCAPVRQAIVENQTESLTSGFESGIRYLRHGQWQPTDDQKHLNLANKYRGYADALRYLQPSIADILDSVAESYATDAKERNERDRWEH